MDAGPMVEDVFRLINRNTDGLRILQDSPVFTELMRVFRSSGGIWPAAVPRGDGLHRVPPFSMLETHR